MAAPTSCLIASLFLAVLCTQPLASHALLRYDIVLGIGADNAVGINTASSFTTSDADILMSNGTALATATEPGSTPLSSHSGKGRASLHAFAVRYKQLGFLAAERAVLLINCGREDTRVHVEWNASGAAYADCASLYVDTLGLLQGVNHSLVAIVVQLGEHEANRTGVRDIAVALQSLVARVRTWSGAGLDTPVVASALPFNFSGRDAYWLATSRVYENAGYLFPYAASVPPQPTHGVSGSSRLDDTAQQAMGSLLAEAWTVARNHTQTLRIATHISGWANHWTFDDTFNDTVGGVVAVAADASDFSARLETNSGRSRFGKVYRQDPNSCVGLLLSSAPENATVGFWHVTATHATTNFVLMRAPSAGGAVFSFVSGYANYPTFFAPNYGAGGSSFLPLGEYALGEWYFIIGTVFRSGSSSLFRAYTNGIGGNLLDDYADVYKEDTNWQYEGTLQIMLGASGSHPGQYCDNDGLTDNLMVFNRVLEPAEMTALYLQTHEGIEITTVPTPAPTVTPTQIPTPSPTRAPTAQPTARPTRPPTSSPTRNPTAGPTVTPGEPTPDPTGTPTAMPTVEPSPLPSRDPTAQPSPVPTHAPTPFPTAEPTQRPTAVPTTEPSARPSAHPSVHPSPSPTEQPSSAPSVQPSEQPTAEPTLFPSATPTLSPTAAPTRVTCSNGQGPVNDTACESCLAGKYSAEATNYTCIDCPAGRFVGVTGGALCFLCIKFRYQSADGQTSCLDCDPGWYAPQLGSTACFPCNPGFFTIGSASQSPYEFSCQGCEAGSFSGGGASQCTPCANGTYAPHGNSSSCMTCNGDATATSCTPTPAPTSSPTPVPSVAPSAVPSAMPSANPSSHPSPSPTQLPSVAPTATPSAPPSVAPTAVPTTATPTVSPSPLPSAVPSTNPTASPSVRPSVSPTATPTTASPTAAPTAAPTRVSDVIELPMAELPSSRPVAILPWSLYVRGWRVNVTPSTVSPCVDPAGWWTRERFELHIHTGLELPEGASKSIRVRMQRPGPAPDDVWFRRGVGLFVCDEASGGWVRSDVYNCSETDDVDAPLFRRDWFIESTVCHNSHYVLREPLPSDAARRFARLSADCVPGQYGCNCEYTSGSAFTSSSLTVFVTLAAVVCWVASDITQTDAEGYPLRGDVPRPLKHRRSSVPNTVQEQMAKAASNATPLASFSPEPRVFLWSQYASCALFRIASTTALYMRVYGIGENDWITRAQGPAMVRLAMAIFIGVEAALAVVRLITLDVQRKGSPVAQRMTWFLFFSMGTFVHRLLVLFPFLSVSERMTADESYSAHWLAGVCFIGATGLLRAALSMWMASSDPKSLYMQLYCCTRLLQVEGAAVGLVWFLLWLLLPCE